MMKPENIDIKDLEKEQIRLSSKINLKDKIPPQKVKLVAGVDVTFTNIWTNPTTSIACITVFDIDTFELKDIVYAEKKIDFPYIPTFLAYRELPVILEAYKKLKIKPDVFLIDGQGILHPRMMGIASHFGVVTDEVSVGVAKSKLVGNFKEPENKKFSAKPIYIDKQLRGYAVRTRKNSKPLFISPGNNISVDSAVKVAIRSIKGDYKLPEPIRTAHNSLQEYRKNLLKKKYKS
ncbi:MAG: endonuclease V [Aquificae bacterium]|nr:endonuclease V [Aquificota bacterium]